MDNLGLLIKAAFEEDLADKGDITSQATIPADQTITATMRAREDGILAGVHIAEQVFHTLDNTIKVEILTQDGEAITTGQDIFRVTGNTQNILCAERVALNFISHLSGIATATNQYVEAVKGTKAKILDTRKTLPGYRVLHKHAVKMGGGTNHRMGLHDMVLIKDNHIAAAGGVTQALNAVRDLKNSVKIEIEVDTLDQLQEVLDHGGADIVMLDNMSPELMKQAVETIDGRLITEASGNVNMSTVRSIAESGVDLISIGALTHSVTVLDLGLDIDE